jgi:hypothetical protein
MRRSEEFAAGHDICLPAFEGEGEFEGAVILVYSSSAKSDPHARAESVRAEFEAMPNVVKDSFKEEDFTTASDLRGVQCSYDARVEALGSRKAGAGRGLLHVIVGMG